MADLSSIGGFCTEAGWPSASVVLAVVDLLQDKVELNGPWDPSSYSVTLRGRLVRKWIDSI